MTPKRKASEMNGESKVEDPFQKVEEVLKECRKSIVWNEKMIISNERCIERVTGQIRKDEEEIQKRQERIMKHKQELLEIKQGMKSKSYELKELKDEEAQLLAVQDQGEEFELQILKAGKVKLGKMMRDALAEVEVSLERKRRQVIKEN